MLNFLLLSLLNNFSVLAVEPGIKLAVTEDLINSYKNSSLNYYLKNVTGLLPQLISFSKAEGVFKVTFTISEIKTQYVYLNVPSTEVDFLSQDVFTVNMTSLNLYIQYNWVYSSLLGSDKGKGFVDVIESNFFAKILVTTNGGVIQLQPQDLQYTISNFVLSFTSASNSKILNTVTAIFKDSIQQSIENSVQDYVKNTLIANINKDLQANDQIYSLPLGLGLYYGVTTAPTINSTYIEFDIDGVFVNSKNPDFTPSVSGNIYLPDFVANSSQVQISFSEYSLNTLGYSLFSSKFFSRTFTELNISGIIVPLTTSNLNSVLPGLSATYGPDMSVSLICSSDLPPVSYIKQGIPNVTNGFVSTYFNSTCAVHIDKTNQDAVTLILNFYVNTTMYVNQWMLHGQINTAQISQLTTGVNNIGQPVNTQGMMNFFNLIINATLPAIGQSFIDNGFPLPNLGHADMINSNVTLMNGYFYVLSSPSFVFNSAYEEI